MILDELIVKLKLDLGRFRSDAQQAEATLNNVGDASRRTARNMESDGNHMASGFGKVRNQLLSILGLFTAGMGIKNFTQSTIKQADAFGFMSDSIGMSTTRLRAYSDAAERAGGSGEAMTDALKKSASDVANLKMGLKTLGEVDQGSLLTRWAGAAGLDPSKIFESGESLLQARLKVFEAIRKADKDNPLLHGVDPAVLANTVLEQGGIGGGVTNALKNKGGLSGFNASVDQREKINKALELSEENARKAREAFFDLNDGIIKFGQNVVVSFLPAIIKVTKALSLIKLPSSEKVSATIEKWIKKLDVLFDKTQKTINLISEKWNAFSETVKKVTDNGVDLTDGFTVVAGVIGGLVAINVVGWITGIVGALAGLVIAAGGAATALAPLAAVAAAGAAGAYAGNKLYQGLGRDSQDFLGKGVAKIGAFFGDKDAQEALDTNEQYEASGDIKTTTPQRQMMSNVYSAYRKAGLSDKQARVMTAEVGRENDYADKYIFGSHTDPHNKQTNTGFLSWQGSRGKALRERLTAKGLMKDGKIVQSQEAIDEQARFSVEEMQSGQYGGIGNFLENKDVDYHTGSRQLGKGYVKWRFDDPKYAAHKTREANYYAKLGQIVGSQASDEQRANMPPPVIIPKGDKDIYGRVKGASSLYASMPSAAGQTSPRVNNNSVTIGSQTFNIKANDTEGIKKELSNKMIISESLTQNFNSGMQ